jgi:hypothetical protein
MAVETSFGSRSAVLADFRSQDGTLRVKLDIAKEWPMLSLPIRIVSCVGADGQECFPRSTFWYKSRIYFLRAVSWCFEFDSYLILSPSKPV